MSSSAAAPNYHPNLLASLETRRRQPHFLDRQAERVELRTEDRCSATHPGCGSRKLLLSGNTHSWQNAMTPAAKARALESADISDFLMEIIMSVPGDAPEPDWQEL